MITRYGEPELMLRSSLYEKEDGEYILYVDYATLAAAARSLVDAIRALDAIKKLSDIYPLTKTYEVALTKVEELLK